jgi:probable HAF family extracellular repeat protein
LALLFSVVLVGGARSAQYSVVDLGPLPGGDSAEALNVNKRGQIVGFGRTATGESHAILWNNGEAIDLGTLGGSSSTAWGINDRGQIVGGAETATAGEFHAFLWQDGQMIDLGGAAGIFNVARAINKRSEVVGQALGPSLLGGLLWRNGTLIDLGIGLAADINDHSVVAGANVAGVHAVLWKAGQVTDLGTLPGGTSSIARSINNHNQVVGESVVDGADHAFVWDNGQMEALGDLLVPFGFSFARGINNRGQIVGESASANVVGGAPHAVLWQDGVPVDLGTLPGDPQSSAAAINDHGLIVGFSGAGGNSPSHAVAWEPGH